MNENTMNNDVTMNNAVTMRPDRGASLGRIDQYELIRELGGGGFGCVYLAKDTVAGIEVAVKGLPPLVRLNKEELENVRQNFALVSRLYHPNITAALHFQKVQSAVYNDEDVKEKLRVFKDDPLVVMQYARGVTLSQWRKQFPEGKVPLDKALEITRQIASALDYAHKERIIHRDIKPANVMIETLPDRSITARVLDFGLAAEIRSSMGRLSLNVTDKAGTRHYMAPEQWSGKKQSKETDQYSLAALFYELILGEVPFASVFDTGDPILMKNVVENDPPEIPSYLPKPIRLALAKALAKKREDRFASCIEFVDALQGGVISGARASSRAFFSRAVAILTAVAALGLAVAGIWYWQQEFSEPNGNVAREDARRPLATSLREADSVRAIPPVNAAREDARPPKNNVPASREDKEYTGPRRGDRKTLTLPGGATMTMIYVAPGSFMMGSPSTEEGRDDDETQHHVTLTKGYWLGETEVTQAQWESVMGDNPSRFKGASRPVENVSWEDCQEFIAKVNREARRQFGGNARLPTEAEWEYACRAGTQTAYSWGNSLNGDKANCDGNYPYGTTIKGTYKQETVNVCSYSPNVWGFYDMHGNVYEWCQDWYGTYSSGAVTDPTGSASGDYRVLRGGSWYNSARICRSANRNWRRPGIRNNGYGFRLACSAGPRD